MTDTYEGPEGSADRPMPGEALLRRVAEDDSGLPLSEGDDETARQTGEETISEEVAQTSPADTVDDEEREPR